MKKFKLYHLIYHKDILNIELSNHKINNNIFLGNQIASSDINFIKSNNITHILNISHEIPNSFNHIVYLNIPISTKHLYSNLDHLFQLSNTFLTNIINNDYKVLIHCKYGHTRSALFLAIFLIHFYNYKPDYVINLIRNIRPNTLLRVNIINHIYNYYNKYISDK